MGDAILDEIQRVRAMLLKKHGGIDGLFKHMETLDRARQRQQKAARTRKSPKAAKSAKPAR